MVKKSLFFLAPVASIFAQDSAAAPAGGATQTLIMFGIAIVFFYFILWRPEQKRRKASEQMRNSLKKGDRVTAMGIVGRVDKINDQTVILKMVDGAKIEMMKLAITDVQSSSEEATVE